MDEIYMLVKGRVQRVQDLNQQLIQKESTVEETQIQFLQSKINDDLRKAKEEEKFRTEKENWILNILKQLKEYTLEQKLILYERSSDIMKLVFPDFKERKVQIQVIRDFFLDEFISLYQEFFSPFEKTYEFKTTLRYIIRSNNPTVVTDMLKYLVEFSRDYFKKFMIYLQQNRNGGSAQGSNAKNLKPPTTAVKAVVTQQSQQQTSSQVQIQQQQIQVVSQQNLKEIEKEKYSPQNKKNFSAFVSNNLSSGKKALPTYSPQKFALQQGKSGAAGAIKLQDASGQKPEFGNVPYFQLRWYQKNQDQLIFMKHLVNEVIPDLDSVQVQLTDYKIKRLRNNPDEMRNLKNQMLEQLKNQNQFITQSLNYFFDQYSKKIGFEKDPDSRTDRREEFVREQKNFIIHLPKSSNVIHRRDVSNPRVLSQNNNNVNSLNNPFASNAKTVSLNKQQYPLMQGQQPNKIILEKIQKPQSNSQNSQAQSNSQNQQNSQSQAQANQQSQYTQQNQPNQQNYQSSSNQKKFDNSLLTKTKIIKLTQSRCNSAFLRPKIFEDESNKLSQQQLQTNHSSEEGEVSPKIKNYNEQREGDVYYTQENEPQITNKQAVRSYLDNDDYEGVGDDETNNTETLQQANNTELKKRSISCNEHNSTQLINTVADKFKTILLNKLNNIQIDKISVEQQNISSQDQQYLFLEEQIIQQQNQQTVLKQSSFSLKHHPSQNSNQENSFQNHHMTLNQVTQSIDQTLSTIQNTKLQTLKQPNELFQNIYNKIKRKSSNNSQNSNHTPQQQAINAHLQQQQQNASTNKYLNLRRSNQQQQLNQNAKQFSSFSQNIQRNVSINDLKKQQESQNHTQNNINNQTIMLQEIKQPIIHLQSNKLDKIPKNQTNFTNYKLPNN